MLLNRYRVINMSMCSAQNWKKIWFNTDPDSH